MKARSFNNAVSNVRLDNKAIQNEPFPIAHRVCKMQSSIVIESSRAMMGPLRASRVERDAVRCIQGVVCRPIL